MHNVMSSRHPDSVPSPLQLGTPFHITLEAPHVVDMRRQVRLGSRAVILMWHEWQRRVDPSTA